MSFQDHQINEYHLSIISVKMKVKFPCKMKIQHCSNSITEQVQSTQQSKFIFNQQITIQEQAEKSSFDFNIILITEKGAKYVSGVIKLQHSELEKSQGQKIICPLIKCLDNQAFCQIKVNKVKAGKLPKRISVSSTLIEMKKQTSINDRNTVNNNQQKSLLSPKAKKSSGVQTRSELGFNGFNARTNVDWQDTRSKGAAQTLIYKSNFLKSPKTKKTFAMCSPKSKLAPDFNHQYQILSHRQKVSTTQSQVYKQGYQKLKQKYKKQSQSLKTEQKKRMQLQANQNNYKIQIMRLKIKSQEQQRIITQKNQKINQLQIVISQINKQELDMEYLKTQNKNLEEKIEMMNDVINGLKKENEVIKKLNQDKFMADKHIIEQLKQQIQSNKQKFDNYTLQSSQNLKQKTQQILSLTTQLKSKTSLIQLQKSQIHKLQTHIQNKIYDFQKTLQLQKNHSTQTSNQLKQKLQLLERQKKVVQKQLNDIKNDKQKMKALILKAEYDKKVLLEEQKVLKGEVLEYKLLKEKFGELNKEMMFLAEDKVSLCKQLELVNQSKEINLKEINQQFQVKLNYHRKLAKEFQEKYKNLASVKIQLESQVEIAKNSIDKQKRQIQGYQNQVAELKNTIKELKQYSDILQQKNLSLQNQVSLTLNKLRFGQQTAKIDAQKYRTQLQRTKNQLGAQNAKAIQLFQQKSNLQIQLNKNRIQLQYHQDKIDKLFTSNKQYQSNIQYMMKQHESQVADLQQTIKKNQKELKNCHQNIHKNELERLEFLEKLENNKKEQKLNEEKMKNLESQLKNRNQDIKTWEDKYKSQQKALNSLEAEYLTLKNQYSIMKNDKNKVQKILEIKKEEIQSLKQDKSKLLEDKSALQKTQSQLRDEIKKLNQHTTKTQIKLKSTDREFNKFKELMFKTIRNQYAKLPLMNNNSLLGLTDSNGGQVKEVEVLRASRNTINLNGQESKITLAFNNNNQNQQQRETTDKILLQTLNTATILTGLTSSITESKTTLFKLIQHNKQLKRQIQSLTQQSEQSSNKYQFTQIQLHQNIQQLQQELKQVYNQKQQQLINNDRLISELNAKIHDKENLCEELQIRAQELEYAISSLKLDFEENSNKNDKKVGLLKQAIQGLEEKIEYYKVSLSNQQDINHQLEQKLQIVKGQKDELLQLSLKNKSTIQDLTHQKQKLQITLQQTTKDRKSLLQKYNSLQIQLNQQKNLKQQNKELLKQEQKKNIQLKQFNTQLIKQKQSIIKLQLEKTDKILELQTVEIELKRDLEIVSEDLQRIKSELEENKEKYRKQTAVSKNLQTQKAELLIKNKKVVEKLEQKQKEIVMKDQIISRLDKKYKELTEKNYKETLELNTQIDMKYNQNINITKELNQKILFLQAKIEQLQHIKAKQHSEYVIISNQLLAQRQNSILLKRQISKLQLELEQTNDEYKSLEKRYEQVNLEIQEKEQSLSELNNKIILLEAELQAVNKDKVLKIQEINTNWQRKYQGLIEQNDQKFLLMQNQRQMIRSQLQQKINELEISLNQNKNSQLGINDIKKNYQEKIKKLENDRLNTILNKNNDIKKLTEENKLLNENIKKLQVAQKENSQLLDNLYKRLNAQQKLKKQYEQRYKTQKKMHQAQTTSLLSKQSRYKTQKQAIYQSVWSNQRQVRKIIQNYIKKILDQCDHAHIDKITNISKGLEHEIVKTMTNNLSSN